MNDHELIVSANHGTGGPRPVLLTVSGRIPDDLDAAVAAGRRPRADYRELARAFDADILDVTAAWQAVGPVTRLAARLAGDDLVLAVACLRRLRRYRVVFTDGERVGFMVAAASWLLRSRARHVMIGHRISAGKKVLLHRLLRLHRRIDRLVVYASSQRDVAISELGYAPEQVVLTPFMVDTRFWTRHAGEHRAERPMLCAVGQELRDYPTLVEAARGLDVDVVIAAASPWSKRADSSAGIDIPANVRVVRLDQFELRELYTRARFAVMPVVETDFQAGITAILEAMSMGLPVVCSLTEGQTDTIVDGHTGWYVPPGDAAALRSAIERLLADPSGAETAGNAARDWVCQHADIELYADRLASVVASVSDEPTPRG